MNLKKRVLIALIITAVLELILVIYGSKNWTYLCKMCDPALTACPPCPSGFSYAIRVAGFSSIPLFLVVLLIVYLVDRFKKK